ncbi:MAG: NAD-dependent deacylase [Burkholderiales bacterium]|nr:NAD-dependent deacylase [Burkholderiales bacterium]
MDFAPELIQALREARHVVVFTGAGVSAESGIPTFRDALSGLWSHFDAEQLATPEAFEADPALVWGWYEWRRRAAARAQPNPAHLAIARMAGLVSQLQVVTQNVDDLHERAGNADVIHLHGNIAQPYCQRCRRPHAVASDNGTEMGDGQRLTPPRCTACGGTVRPGVVWFGESLPQDAWNSAEAAVRSCDLLVCVGTSGLVQPAAMLPVFAARAGAATIQINPDPTPLNEHVRWNLQGPAGKVLPVLVGQTWA